MKKPDVKRPRVRRAAPRLPQALSAGRSRRASAAPGQETPYHHGALRDALLQAAERLLERDGVPGLTLRAVAREAGVSHAAPTHHFGDLTGLVSELAAIGYRRFGAAMAAAATASLTDHGASARAYVGFARAHPGMYGLMFRTERLDMTRPSLRDAANASFAGFTGAIGAFRGEQISTEKLTLDQAGAMTLAWSMVHGFTTLLLDGRLGNILARLPEGADADALLEATLRATMRPPRGP